MIVESKKELIRDGAIEVIAKNGFQNTKIKDIATEVLIGSGTIYNYFNSKDEIMEYIIITELEKRASILKKAKENKQSFKEVISAVLDYYMETIVEKPALVKLMMQETFQMMESSKLEVCNIINENRKLMTEFIVQAQQAGEVSKNLDVAFIATAISYSFQSCAYTLVNTEINKEDLQKMKKQILQCYVNGLI